MNFMERIQQRITEREHRRVVPKAATKTRQNIVFNRFDKQMWGEIRKNDEVDHDITDLMVGDLHSEEGRRGYDNAPELLQDLTYTLYKPDPRMVDKRNVEKDARLNRSIIEEVQKSPYYDELREHTVLDDTCTTIALTTMAETIREILLRNQEAAQESNREKAEQEGEMNNEDNRPPGVSPAPPSGESDEEGDSEPGEGEGDEEGEPGEGDSESQGGGQGPPGDQENDEDGDDSEGEPNSESNQGEPGTDPSGEQGDTGDPGDLIDHEAESDFDDDPNLDDEEHEADPDLEEDIARAVNQAMREAADDVDELEAMRKGIGLEDGEWRSMSPEERLAMADQLRTPHMREMAEMIGRMKRFAMGQQATKIVDVPHAPVGVEQGDDLRHLLASEYALLDDEDTEWEFFRRYMDKEMLQYKLQGEEKAGRGPIYACIDKSHSMSGRPFVWAMGVAEALRRICQEQQRDYFATFFGNNNDYHDFSFPKGGSEFRKVLEFLSCQANGGTQFDGVLEKALAKIATQHEDGLERADIVFITDGQASLSEEWVKDFNAEKERVGCRVFGIYIGGASDMYGERRGPTQVLESFSDYVIPISDLSVESVRDVFARV